MDWPAGVAFVLYEHALWLGPRGRYAQALEAAQVALAIAEDIAHQQWVAGALCALRALHLDLLDALAVRSHFERALGLAHEIGSLNWLRISMAFLVPTYLLQGERDRAAAVLEAAIEEEAPTKTVGQRLCWRARAQLALARGDVVHALQIVDQPRRRLTVCRLLSGYCLERHLMQQVPPPLEGALSVKYPLTS
jgi:tetratricopeptide (TPR) repeat protein